MVKAVCDLVGCAIEDAVGCLLGDPIGMVNPIAILESLAFLRNLGQPLSLCVCVVPEVEEENQEDQSVETNNVEKNRELVGAVLHEDELTNVDSHHHKLNQLDGGHVFLPPQVLLIGRPHSTHSIVGVHEDVDTAVQHGMEGSHTTC